MTVKLKKIFLLAISSLMLITTIFTNIVYADSKNAGWYTMVPIFDLQQKQIMIEIFNDTNKSLSEGRALANSRQIMTYGNSDKTNLQNDINNIQISKFGGQGSVDSFKVLSLPAVKTSSGRSASYADFQQTQKIASNVTAEINSVLGVIVSEVGIETDQQYINAAETLAELLNKENGSATITGNNGDITVTLSQKSDAKDITDGYNKGAKANYFKTITVNNIKKDIQTKYPTGYQKGQALYSETEDEVLDIFYTADFLTVALYWEDKGICNDFSDFKESNDTIESITSFFFSIVSGALGAVGFKTLESVVYGTDSSYFMGIMRSEWFQYLTIIYWAMLILSIIILITSVVKLLAKRNLAIISPSIRTSLKDGITKIILSIALIALSIPIFYLMVWINYEIITIFATMVEGRTLVNSIANGNFFIALVNIVMQTIILVKINVKYITRALTIGICYAISPIAISTLGLTEKGQIFWTWLKELFVEIFTQSFDAIVLTFMILISSIRTSFVEQVLLAFAFFPLSKWFKNTLMGFSGQGSEGVADEIGKSAGAAAAVGTGIAAATIGGSIKNVKENREAKIYNKEIEKQSELNKLDNDKNAIRDSEGNILKDSDGKTMYRDGYFEKSTLDNGGLRKIRENRNTGTAILGGAVRGLTKESLENISKPLANNFDLLNREKGIKSTAKINQSAINIDRINEKLDPQNNQENSKNNNYDNDDNDIGKQFRYTENNQAFDKDKFGELGYDIDSIENLDNTKTYVDTQGELHYYNREENIPDNAVETYDARIRLTEDNVSQTGYNSLKEYYDANKGKKAMTFLDNGKKLHVGIKIGQDGAGSKTYSFGGDRVAQKEKTSRTSPINYEKPILNT